MTTLERINNAIATLSLHTPNSTASAGVKRAVQDLVTAWVAFWNSSERQYTPDVMLDGKAKKFVEWYARAFVLVPTTVRSKCPDPRTLNPAWSEMAADSMKFSMQSYQSAASTAVQAGLDATEAVTAGVTQAAQGLRESLGAASDAVNAPFKEANQAMEKVVLVAAAGVGAYALFVLSR